jgi:hypothetical protein
VLGNRPLDLDGLEPATFVNGNSIQKGFTKLRAWRRDDTARYPALSWWGYDVIQTTAQERFLGHAPRNA